MDFEYIPRTVAGPSIDSDLLECTLQGCDCDGECTAAAFCPCIASSMDNYDENGRLMELRQSDGAPLLECHDSCACVAVGCANRRVQYGVRARLEVLPSGTKGLGLFTVDDIARGDFVCEYAGELIGGDEVERRRRLREEGEQEEVDEDERRGQRVKRRSKHHQYVLTVKEHCADATVHTWYIDPSRRGNLGRYCNHSCAPNLDVVVLRVGTVAPIVGLFANRSIAAGAELCYDYGASALSEGEGGVGRKECECGADGCRRWLPLSEKATD